MDLSVRQAAVFLGRSARTIRAQLARGDLPGKKVKGEWRIRRRDLPLTDSQRGHLQAKADRVRRAVDAALPSRLAVTSSRRQRSLADLDAFRFGAQLLSEIRSCQTDPLSKPALHRVERLFENALLALAEGMEQYERRVKLEALNRARGSLAQIVAVLLIETGIPPPEPVFDWVIRLENNIIPSVSGLARWADTLRKRR